MPAIESFNWSSLTDLLLPVKIEQKGEGRYEWTQPTGDLYAELLKAGAAGYGESAGTILGEAASPSVVGGFVGMGLTVLGPEGQEAYKEAGQSLNNIKENAQYIAPVKPGGDDPGTNVQDVRGEMARDLSTIFPDWLKWLANH